MTMPKGRMEVCTQETASYREQLKLRCGAKAALRPLIAPGAYYLSGLQDTRVPDQDCPAALARQSLCHQYQSRWEATLTASRLHPVLRS